MNCELAVHQSRGTHRCHVVKPFVSLRLVESSRNSDKFVGPLESNLCEVYCIHFNNLDVALLNKVSNLLYKVRNNEIFHEKARSRLVEKTKKGQNGQTVNRQQFILSTYLMTSPFRHLCAHIYQQEAQ